MLGFKRVESVGIILLGSIILGVFLGKVKSVDFKFQQNDFKMKFERLELVSFNKLYVKMFTITTFKYNRTHPVVNMTFQYNIDLGYENEIITQAYVFLSNEYREFPLRLEVNFCEAVSKNYIGGKTLTNCGNFTGCPLKKGKVYHACNWAPDERQYPPFIPNGHYMLELQGLYHGAELYVMRAYGIVHRPIEIPLGKKRT